jgi:transcriptional regulator with XRE-family HTH domain
MDSFGALARRLRNERNMTLQELANKTGWSAHHLGRIERGERTPTPDLTKDLDYLYGAGTTLSDLASDPLEGTPQALRHLNTRRADVDRRTFHKIATYSTLLASLPLNAAQTITEPTKRISTERVNALNDIVEHFIAYDERFGGNNSLTLVKTLLATEIADALEATPDTPTAHTALRGAAASAAYLAGWKSYDAGDHKGAQHYYREAYSHARIADPHGHAGFCLRIMSLHALRLGDNANGLLRSEQALATVTGHLSAANTIPYQLAVARARAENSDTRGTMEMLRIIETKAAGADFSDIPAYARPWNAPTTDVYQFMGNQFGKTLASLGDYTAAGQFFEAASNGWNPTTHPRIWGLTRCSVGAVHHLRGDIDTAETIWGQARDALVDVDSQRVTDALYGIDNKRPDIILNLSG